MITNKGNCSNESIKYSSIKKKQQNTQEKNVINYINNIEMHIENTQNINNLETLRNELNIKRIELEEIIDIRIKGCIIRSKAQFVEYNEKNSK